MLAMQLSRQVYLNCKRGSRLELGARSPPSKSPITKGTPVSQKLRRRCHASTNLPRWRQRRLGIVLLIGEGFDSVHRISNGRLIFP